MHFDFGLVGIILQLIFLEGILSIDNAAVLGAMVSILPKDKPVPYPRSLHFLQAWTNRVLGMQRLAALKVGLLGAYLGRALMLVLASHVMNNAWLRVLGAAYLIKLAFEHLSQPDLLEHEEEVDIPRMPGKTFWLVVLNLELADLAFSLDNVVAAVALSRDLWVVMLGVALGIVTMRFAAGIFTHFIEKEPVLATAAYIIVLDIGAELLLEEFFHFQFADWQKFAISIGTIALCVVGVRLKFLHPVFTPLLRELRRGMGGVNQLINWVLWPLLFLIKLPFQGLSLVRNRASAQSSSLSDNPEAAALDPTAETSERS